MKLSIIVPVYGVEKYILQFAESLLFQLNDEVELIIINDGTKDKSIDLLKEYVKENEFQQKNIVWLEQENQGQSVARNYGISIAQGEYVTFLDPDDYVVSEYISVILENIKSVTADLFQYNAKVMRGDKIFGSLDLVNDDNFVNAEPRVLEKIIKKKMWFSWLRIVKKDLLEMDFFPKGVNFQDIMAFPGLYKKLQTIKNINRKLVIYRIHQESSVNSFKPSEKMTYSAEYGLNLFEGSYDKIDLQVYIQFVEICIDYKLRAKGLIYSINWMLRNIFFNKKSTLYGNLYEMVKLTSKLTLINLYRIFKGIK